jgi:hypothetical protein
MAVPVATEEGEMEEMLSLLVCPAHKGVLIALSMLDSIISSNEANKRIVKAMDELQSQDSAVAIATGHRLDGGGFDVRVLIGARIFSSCCPDRLWGSPSLQSSGYWGSFPGGKAA